MSDNIIKASRLTSIPKNFDGIAQSLLYELPGESGYVFGVYYISGKKTAIKEKMAITLNEHIDRFRQTLSPNTNIARKFEHMLQAINDQLSSISKDFQQFPLSNLHAVIGVSSKKQLFLSGFGNILAEYLHKTAQSRYTIYELNNQFEPLESTTWDKVFISVLDGELHPNDVFYIGLPISSNELDHSLLQETLTTLPPAGSLKRLEQFLGATEPYAGLCLQVSKPQSNTRKKINPITSIDNLNKTKNQTSELLGETTIVSPNNISERLKAFAKKLHNPGHRGTGAVLKKALRQLIRLLAVIVAGLSYIAATLKPLLAEAGKWLKEKQLHRKAGSLASSIFKRALNLRKASLQTRLLAVFAIVAVIGSLYIGTRLIRQGQESQLVSEFEDLQVAIVTKQSEARNRLIFNDTETARSLLTESNALIDSLPDIRSKRSELKALEEEAEKISNEIQGITVPEVNLLAEYGDNLSNITTYNNGTYVANGKKVAFYNNVEGTLNTEFELSSGFSEILKLIGGEDLLILDNSKQLGRLASDSGNPIISGTNNLSSITDTVLYNDNLYVLNPDSEQVIRMRSQAGNFEAGTPWIISKTTSLTTANGITIDGDVYISTPNDLLKFRSGRELPFEEAQVDPSPQNITDIYTSTDLDHLYALEPAESRILVFDKEGEFITQYKTPELESATDFLVDTDKLQLLFTSEDKLYSFTLDHLLN